LEGYIGLIPTRLKCGVLPLFIEGDPIHEHTDHYDYHHQYHQDHHIDHSHNNQYMTDLHNSITIPPQETHNLALPTEDFFNFTRVIPMVFMPRTTDALHLKRGRSPRIHNIVSSWTVVHAPGNQSSQVGNLAFEQPVSSFCLDSYYPLNRLW
jgi:hypothetical protein